MYGRRDSADDEFRQGQNENDHWNVRQRVIVFTTLECGVWACSEIHIQRSICDCASIRLSAWTTLGKQSRSLFERVVHVSSQRVSWWRFFCSIGDDWRPSVNEIHLQISSRSSSPVTERLVSMVVRSARSLFGTFRLRTWDRTECERICRQKILGNFRSYIFWLGL